MFGLLSIGLWPLQKGVTSGQRTGRTWDMASAMHLHSLWENRSAVRNARLATGFALLMQCADEFSDASV